MSDFMEAMPDPDGLPTLTALSRDVLQDTGDKAPSTCRSFFDPENASLSHVP
jgi:hypothetical protein